jgi:uncharacterized protein YegL
MALTKEKAIDFVKKLKRQSESELNLGNEGAASLFQEKAEEIIANYSLLESDLIEEIDSKFQIINELGKTIVQNPFLRQNAKRNLHQEWFSLLAEEVAKNYKCKTTPRVNEGSVSFYGYDLDREMAIFMFLRLADVANTISKKELPIAKKNVGKNAMKDFATGEMITFPQKWFGDDRFFDSFHFGFRESLKELHEKQQNGIIPPEVVKYFEDNKNSDGYYYASNENFYSSNIAVPEYIKIGQKAGRIAFKKSTSSTALISSKAKDKINSIIQGENTVILAIDESSSMDGDKLNQAKEGALDFAKRSIEKGFKVGIIGFGSEARIISRPENNIEKLESLIANLSAGGCTRMSQAIRIGISLFTSRKAKRTIAIVTDGEPYSWNGKEEEKSQTLLAAADAKRLGIKIIAIGCDGADEEFLQKLASEESLGLLVDRTQLLLSMGNMAQNI